MGRAPCCEKVGLKRGRWTAEEDEILIDYIKKNGEGSWRSLPKNAGLLRCGKSCRLRWINYLRADLKRGNFTVEEEETIIKLHRSVGNRWSLIASHLPGRTDNEVKNYWNSHLSRKIYSFRSSNGNLISSIDLLKMTNSCKRRGGRVSRSVAKKYNKAMRTNTAVNGTQELTEAANAKAFNTRVGQNDARNGTRELTTATEQVKVGPAVDEIERGSSNSMHDSCCDSQEVCHGMLSRPANDLGGVIEVLGPFEEPDDVTALLDQFFLSELSDLCKISINNEEKANGTMAPGSSLIGEERNSGVWHSFSSSSSGSGLQEEFFSPLNSYFEDVMTKLDTSDAAIGFGLWD